MIARITSGGGSAGTTIDNASGGNDGPGLPVIAAVIIGAYVVWNMVM